MEIHYQMEKPEPIFLVDLLPKIDILLLEVLEDLSLEDWERQSIAPKWKVKDIASHLLDGNYRTLSILRDDYSGDPPENIKNHRGMVQYLNRLNADWVKASKRLSPQVLIQFDIKGENVKHFFLKWEDEKWLLLKKNYPSPKLPS